MMRKGEMSGGQRAAAFLMSLDKEAAANVIKHVDESVIVEVIEAMNGLDPEMLGPESLRKLDRDLVKSLRRPRVARLRSPEELRIMLEQTLGSAQAASLYDKIQQRLLHDRPFMAIEREEPRCIAEALGEESDAVAALVLANLDPSLSADVLARLDEARAHAVVKRMAGLASPPRPTLAVIAEDLKAKLAARRSESGQANPAKMLRAIANVLKYVPPAVEKRVLDRIQQDDAQSATTIRELMFTWEDLGQLERQAMQKLLMATSARTLALALKASSPAVEANILENLSERVRQNIAEERSLAGAVPMKDVIAARNEIMTAVRGLIDSGGIVLMRAGEDLVR